METVFLLANHAFIERLLSPSLFGPNMFMIPTREAKRNIGLTLALRPRPRVSASGPGIGEKRDD